MAALEYFNGSSWVTLSNVSATTLTGAVTGSGIGTIATSLSGIITVSNGLTQEFQFNTPFVPEFQLTNLYSPTGVATAYNTFTMRTGNKDFYFKHTLSAAANVSNIDNGIFSLYAHNNTVSTENLIFSTSYSASLAAYITNFTTYLGIGGVPNSPLHINAGNNNPRILTLYENRSLNNHFFGFGVNDDGFGLVMTYVVPTGYRHVWYSVDTSYHQLMELWTNGNLGLGGGGTDLARLVILRGVQNVLNEDSCIRVRSDSNATKIEIENVNSIGNLYELRSNIDGSFSIVNRTTGNLVLNIDNSNNLSASRIYARRASALITINNNATTTLIITANTYVKPAGVYSFTYLTNDWTTIGPSAANGRIIYGSNYPIYANIKVDINASHSGGVNDIITFALVKNSILITTSVVFGNTAGNGKISSFSLNTIIPIASGDYLEVACSHNVSGRTITVSNLLWNISAT